MIAFDADWQWAVPLTRAGDTQKIAADLATLTPGGGTIMFPALEEADRVLSASSSPLRHVILLTDGLTDAADFKGLVARMAQHHITVSTVAVGDDADTELLADHGALGRGPHLRDERPPRRAADIPHRHDPGQPRAPRGEELSSPRGLRRGNGPRAFPRTTCPACAGFVLTYMKSGAEQVLSALYDAPLLAAWRYGLGRTAAFTSDFSGRWSAALLAWDQFPRFAAQLVRWIERPADPTSCIPGSTRTGARATVTVDAYDSLGALVNGLDISGILLRPSGARVELRVPQTGPGLYQAVFPADEAGGLHPHALRGFRGGDPAAPHNRHEHRLLGGIRDARG